MTLDLQLPPQERWWRHLPQLSLVTVALGLSLLGLLVLFSIGRARDGAAWSLFLRQGMWLLIALGAMLVTMRLNLPAWRSYAWVLAGGMVLLLIAVLIPGVGLKVNGARRWLDLGPFNMQVSDFAKLAYVFLLAHLLAYNQRHGTSFWRGFVLPGGLIALTCGLIFLQPDYGTAVLVATVGGIMLFLAGVRLLYLIPTALVGVCGVGFMIWQDPVRLQRILSFLDLETNRNDGAYQLWQGLLAFGSGGTSGVGLGQGRQQLAYLPEAHTDFIFPIIGEELGLWAAAGVVLAFIGVIAVVGSQLRRAPNLFEFLLVTGSLLFITLQAVINFGVTTGLLPTKGMSLPFISYGGSNLVANFILIGVILNCLGEWDRRKPQPGGELEG